MNATEIVSQELAYTDNINPTDSDYADRRVRILYLLREVAADVITDGEWTWLRKVATPLTVAAGTGYVNLPVTFGQLGDYGGVYLLSQQSGDPLEHVPEHEIRQAQMSGVRTDTPGMFSIFGEDPITFAKRLNFPLNTGAYNVAVDYLLKVPDIDETVANVNNIKLIPEEWHQRVLLPGIRAKSLESKGDARWQNHQAAYLAGLKRMRGKFRRRQGTIWQLPGFFGR
jgi:hypothetical protein